MRRVAFLSYDWDYEIVSAYYAGMQEFLATRDDCQLIIFSAFGKYDSYDPEAGALAVFSMCNLQEYDGIIIQGNRMWPPEMRQRIVDEATSLGKPVVSINYGLAGATSVGTDNYAAMYGLVKTIMQERERTRPAFVNGLATSMEAQLRLQAFRNVCWEYGINDPRVYQANWQMEEGVKAALSMLENPHDLPDAIICCNDDLAVGVQETLLAHGVRIPEDVMVSGFDNREISLKASPRITTIDRDYRGIGATALRTLLGVIEGEAMPSFIASDVRYVLGESCGYTDDAVSKTTIASDLYTIDSALHHFFGVLNRLQPKLLNADSLTEIMQVCEHSFHEARCPGVYLVINENYLVDDTDHDVTSYGPISHLMAYHDERLTKRCDDRHVYASFLTKWLLPPMVQTQSPVYIIYPLRHNATCLGAFVTDGVSPLMQFGFLTYLLTLVSGAIESVRKKELLQAANSRLDNLYVHDELSGLFNRFGLNRFGESAYKHLLRDYGEAMIIFVDIDNMKLINDVYGHKMGDQALRATADIIRRTTSGEDAFAMRYGGDEFLLICRQDLTARIGEELRLLKRGRSFPYDLTLSMGSYRVYAHDQYSMKKAIELADEQMYQIKKTHKEQRGD